MACGNNKIDRSYLSSQPSTSSPLAQIQARVDFHPRDRLKADVWTTESGRFVDKSGVQRRHPGVTSAGEGGWNHEPASGQPQKSYTHLTGRAGWLGPRAVTDRLPEAAQRALESRRVIVLGTSPNQTWVNERATTFTSAGKKQTTVVRPAKK